MAFSSLVPYVGYGGPLVVTGKGEVRTYTMDGRVTQIMEWHLQGTDPKCGSIDVAGIAGGCGIHIHRGTDCSKDAGGHHYAASVPDPWGAVRYSFVNGRSDVRDMSPPHVFTGLDPDHVNGHAVVVHDSRGAKIACGIVAHV